MDLYTRDKLIQLLRKTLVEQQDFQLQNMKYVKTDLRENEILGIIKQDYKKHYDFMLYQKQEQEKQLLSLLHYLTKSAEQAEITQNLLIHTKGEKKRLIEEIERVRGEIDKLITENNEIIGT